MWHTFWISVTQSSGAFSSLFICRSLSLKVCVAHKKPIYIVYNWTSTSRWSRSVAQWLLRPVGFLKITGFDSRSKLKKCYNTIHLFVYLIQNSSKDILFVIKATLKDQRQLAISIYITLLNSKQIRIAQVPHGAGCSLHLPVQENTIVMLSIFCSTLHEEVSTVVFAFSRLKLCKEFTFFLTFDFY